MKQIAAGVVTLLFLFSVPAIAIDKDAKSQCKVEYKEAKKAAGKLNTHHERVDAKKDAKKKYNECIEHAKGRA
jgi:hypothetical protein